VCSDPSNARWLPGMSRRMGCVSTMWSLHTCAFPDCVVHVCGVAHCSNVDPAEALPTRGGRVQSADPAIPSTPRGILFGGTQRPSLVATGCVALDLVVFAVGVTCRLYRVCSAQPIGDGVWCTKGGRGLGRCQCGQPYGEGKRRKMMG
jgi:hypothetical protein